MRCLGNQRFFGVRPPCQELPVVSPNRGIRPRCRPQESKYWPIDPSTSAATNCHFSMRASHDRRWLPHRAMPDRMLRATLDPTWRDIPAPEPRETRRSMLPCPPYASGRSFPGGLRDTGQTLSDSNGRFQQRQRMHGHRRIERQLQGDGSAQRVPDNMRALIPRASIRSRQAAASPAMLDRRKCGASRAAVAVIEAYTIPVLQAGLGQEWPKDVGNQHAVDEDDGLTTSNNVKLQSGGIDRRGIHGDHPPCA